MEKEITETGMTTVVLSDFAVEEVKAKQIQALFSPMLEKMTELECEYNEVLKLSKTKENCKKAGDLRRKYVKVRTSTEKLRKEQKDFYLAGGKLCDALGNAQKFAALGIEEKLSAIEKHYEVEEAKRIEELHEQRKNELEKFGAENIPANLGEFEEDIYANFLLGTETSFNAKKKLEEERVAKEKAEAEQTARVAKEKADEEAAEQKRIADENESLRVQAEVDKKALEAAEAKAQEEKEAREAEALEAKAKEEAIAEAARVELERVEAENAKKLAEEKEAREALEKIEADRLAKIEADKAAEEKAKSDLAKAPDKKQLLFFAAKIKTVEVPKMSTLEGQRILDAINILLGKVSVFVDEQTGKM